MIECVIAQLPHCVRTILQLVQNGRIYFVRIVFVNSDFLAKSLEAGRLCIDQIVANPDSFRCGQIKHTDQSCVGRIVHPD